MTSNEKQGLLERLEQGPVICAEGYLFECERRGYLQAGAFVPEVVLDHPEVVTELHREFVHAGSDVVEAFTYYGHREKLRIVGKEHLLEELNVRALELPVKESGILRPQSGIFRRTPLGTQYAIFGSERVPHIQRALQLVCDSISHANFILSFGQECMSRYDPQKGDDYC